MRSAMRARSRVIGTRCSVRPPRRSHWRGGAGGGGRRGRRRRRHGGAAILGGEKIHHVRLRHPAVAAGADQRLRIELVLLGHALGGRAQLDAVRPGGPARHARMRRGGGVRAPARRAAPSAASHDGGRARAGHRGASSISASTWPLVTVGAVLELDLREHAGRRRRHFQHHFVGLQIDQILVARDRFAGLLVPRDQGGVRHRFRQLRHPHFDCHEPVLV